jgi:hypothetical protein
VWMLGSFWIWQVCCHVLIDVIQFYPGNKWKTEEKLCSDLVAVRAFARWLNETDVACLQLLTELDGVEALTGVFVFAATRYSSLWGACCCSWYMLFLPVPTPFFKVLTWSVGCDVFLQSAWFIGCGTPTTRAAGQDAFVWFSFHVWTLWDSPSALTEGRISPSLQLLLDLMRTCGHINTSCIHSWLQYGTSSSGTKWSECGIVTATSCRWCGLRGVGCLDRWF